MKVNTPTAVIWILACIFTAWTPWSSADQGPGIQDYGALPNVSLVAISPDGDRLAYRRHTDEVDALVVVSLASGEMLQGFELEEVKPRSLYFLDQSRLIAVMSEHKDMVRYKESFDLSTALVFDIDTGKHEQLLTPGRRILIGQTGLGRLSGLSPDGEAVYMPAYVDDAPVRKELKEIRLDKIHLPRTKIKGSHHTYDYFVSPDGRFVIEEVFNDLAGYHALVLHEEEGEREIFRMETTMPQINVVGFTPDLKNLVYSDEKAGREIFRTLRIEDGTKMGVLFERKDADVSFALTGLNQVVYGVAYGGFKPSYEFFDPALTQRMAAIQEQYPEHSVWLEDWSSDWRHWVVKVEGSNSSGDYLLYTEGQPAQFLTSARPGIKPEQVNPIIEFNYRARDGQTIPALLTVPVDRLASLQKLPTVIYPHGGPHLHDQIGFNWMAQALASRGYLVVQPQFRGSTGFGSAHWEAGFGQWGKLMQNDITDAVGALVKEGLIDPGRVCIAGASYGGYAALAGGAFTPELYRCVVSIAGISDLPAMLAEEERNKEKYDWRLEYWKTSMVSGDAKREDLDAVSPVNYAEQFKAPVLLLHGEDDRVVYYSQSSSMYSALKRHDKPVKLVKLEAEDHYLSRSKTRLQTLESVLTFIDSHLKTE